MSLETVRTAITDWDWQNKLLSVVQSINDPTKYGLVICNPDWSRILWGGFYEADNSEITTTYTYWGFTNWDSVYQINRRDNTTFVKTMAIGAWADRLTLSYT